MAAVTAEIRARLAKLASAKRTRVTVFTEGEPTVWQPYEIMNPAANDLPFTDDGAWCFIADVLLSGHPIEEMQLQKPPGQLAYVLRKSVDPTKPDIYIKLSFSRDGSKVIGRSFHLSTELTDHERARRTNA